METAKSAHPTMRPLYPPSTEAAGKSTQRHLSTRVTQDTVVISMVGEASGGRYSFIYWLLVACTNNSRFTLYMHQHLPSFLNISSKYTSVRPILGELCIKLYQW